MAKWTNKLPTLLIKPAQDHEMDYKFTSPSWFNIGYFMLEILNE